MSELEGHGIKTKGGLEGELFVVNETGDSKNGCTLRAGLQHDDPMWIVFHEKIKGKTIQLEGKIFPKSFKTIDGRYRQIKIRGEPDSRGCGQQIAIQFENQTHLIVNDMTFDGGDGPHVNELCYPDIGCGCGDAILMRYSEKIWIHRNHFYNWADMAVQGKDDNRFTTITQNKFEKQAQGVSSFSQEMSFGRNWCKG